MQWLWAICSKALLIGRGFMMVDANKSIGSKHLVLYRNINSIRKGLLLSTTHSHLGLGCGKHFSLLPLGCRKPYAFCYCYIWAHVASNLYIRDFGRRRPFLLCDWISFTNPVPETKNPFEPQSKALKPRKTLSAQLIPVKSMGPVLKVKHVLCWIRA